MKLFFISLMFTIMFALWSEFTFATVNHLPEDIRVVLSDVKSFQAFKSISAIPRPVQTSFALAVGEDSFSMAEPGAKWQRTDIILRKRLPRRRLAIVALSQSFCILFYELGGRVHSFHVRIFRISKVGAKLVWRANPPSNICRPEDLDAAIEAGVVKDDPKYYF